MLLVHKSLVHTSEIQIQHGQPHAMSVRSGQRPAAVRITNVVPRIAGGGQKTLPQRQAGEGGRNLVAGVHAHFVLTHNGPVVRLYSVVLVAAVVLVAVFVVVLVCCFGGWWLLNILLIVVVVDMLCNVVVVELLYVSLGNCI